MNDNSKNVKILCVCREGNVRSVATKRRLNRRKYFNVVAVGIAASTPELKNMLCSWADIILIAEPHHIKGLPDIAAKKINNDFTIGADVWSNFNNPELQELIKHQLNKIGL